MPKYSYNVINQENKPLSGTISAPDEKAARGELNQLGFSVIGINEIPEEQQNAVPEGPTLPTFEFAGIDKNQKRVVGTIQSEDRYGAYKRLVNEYTFEVEYLVDQSLPEAEKNDAKIKGVFELQNKMDEENQLSMSKAQGAANQDLKEFEQKQDVLKLQVDFVLKKVKEMLDLYEPEMKPETKGKIREYVDKILRIKSSTNLDYIRQTCEELLTFLQKEELFLHGEARLKERTQMVMEAKSMMMQLHSTKSKSSMSIHDALSQWREQHIIKNQNPSSLEKFADFFVGIIIGFVPENEEIKEIQHNIAIVNQQIRQYLLLSFQAATPEYKQEARTSLKKLRIEKKRLVIQLKEAKKRLQQEYFQRADLNQLQTFSTEVLTFTGWLLMFYLIYYFVSIYLNTKQFGIPVTLPETFSIYKTNFLKYFLSTLFLFHCALSVKINFFRRSEVATLVITPIFLLSTMLIILNF